MHIKKDKEYYVMIIQFNSIQFNSIQFFIIYVPSQ
jgi:hypothetical protein